MNVNVPNEILVDEVTKIFKTGFNKRKTAVDCLSLSVGPGEVMGLLGPNGSGKSTTIKMLLGFIRPTRGTLTIYGGEPTDTRTRRRIGYLPENPRFQKFLRAEQVLKYYGALVGLSGKTLSTRVDYLLKLIGLEHAARERVLGFSKGMVQRLAIAQAIIHVPDLLIFDEPMSGLDPVGRTEIRKLILSIREEIPKATILFSTHVLDDIENLCTKVAVLKKGKLHSLSSAREILQHTRDKFEIMVVGNQPQDLPAQSRKLPLGWAIPVEGMEQLKVYLDRYSRDGFEILSIHNRRRSLEEELFTNQSAPSVEATP